MSKIQKNAKKTHWKNMQDHKNFKNQSAGSSSPVKNNKRLIKHNTNNAADLLNYSKMKSTNSNKLELPKNLIEKFSRGDGLSGTGIKTNLQRIRLGKSDKVVEWATEQAARTTLLQTENAG